MKERKYKPIYGFGWFLSDSTLIDVPEAFTLADIKEDGEALIGIVNTPHSLAGKQLEITIRTKARKAILTMFVFLIKKAKLS